MASIGSKSSDIFIWLAQFNSNLGLFIFTQPLRMISMIFCGATWRQNSSEQKRAPSNGESKKPRQSYICALFHIRFCSAEEIGNKNV